MGMSGSASVPDSEEVVIRSASGFLVPTPGLRTTKLEMRQRARNEVAHDSTVRQQHLKLGARPLWLA